WSRAMATISSKACSNSPRRSTRPSFLPTCQSAVWRILTAAPRQRATVEDFPRIPMKILHTPGATGCSRQAREGVVVLDGLLLARRPRREREGEHQGGGDARLEQHHRAGFEEPGARPRRGEHPTVLAALRLGGVEAAGDADRGVLDDLLRHPGCGLLGTDQEDAEGPPALGNVDEGFPDGRLPLPGGVLVELVEQDHLERLALARRLLVGEDLVEDGAD